MNAIITDSIQNQKEHRLIDLDLSSRQGFMDGVFLLIILMEKGNLAQQNKELKVNSQIWLCPHLLSYLYNFLFAFI